MKMVESLRLVFVNGHEQQEFSRTALKESLKLSKYRIKPRNFKICSLHVTNMYIHDNDAVSYIIQYNTELTDK
jgi:hypothetical protein